MIGDFAQSPAMRVYQAALGTRSWDLMALERETGLPEAELIVVQDYLAKLGLLARTSPDGFDFVPLTPDATLRAVLESTIGKLAEMTRQLVEVQQVIETVGTEYRPPQAALRFPAQIELIAGRPAMSRVMEDAVRRAQRSVAFMCLGPQPSMMELRHESIIYRAMLRRGVKVRYIHRRALATVAPVQRHLRSLSEAGAQIRVVPELPTQMVVVDADFAILPAPDQSGEPAVLALENTPLINFVSGIFEHYWDAGAPLPGEGLDRTVGLSLQHEEVLRMLATGMHDDGVARRMGVSTRTVRRLVAEAMEWLDAHSRFQAGMRAAILGRVGTDPATAPEDD